MKYDALKFVQSIKFFIFIFLSLNLSQLQHIDGN